MDNQSDRLSHLSPAKRALLQKALLARAGSNASISAITRRTSPSVAPASLAQRPLWFLHQLDVPGALYNILEAVQLTGALDPIALERSLNTIVQRHEVLRTSFSFADGQVMQVIAPAEPLAFPLTDLGPVPEARRPAEVERIIRAQVARPFDLERGPLLRCTLLRLAPAEHVLILIFHHIIYDGWSSGVLFHELFALYEAYRSGGTSPLPELAVQYGDFAAWQQQWAKGQGLQSQLAYWKEKLAGCPSLLELPTDRPRPTVQTFDGSSQRLPLPAALCEALTALSRREGVTLSMLFLTAFKVLLHRYCGQTDVVVGSPVANRRHSSLEGLIGFFVNTVALRSDLSGNPGFRELLGRVREVALDAYAHQDVPVDLVVEAVRPERSVSHSPLFAVVFSYEAATGAREVSGLKVSPIRLPSATAKFDLTLTIEESGDGLTADIEYNTHLFDDATIIRMLGHFQVLLEGVAADPERPIGLLPVLSEAERSLLLEEANPTVTDFPRLQTISALFEEQAERTPGAVAVVFGEQQLSYGALNRQANRVAHYLRANGVGEGTLVGLCMERSAELLVAILAILKAGGAYVPFDPEYPRERLAFMLDDTQVPILLAQAHVAGRLSSPTCRIVVLDDEQAQLTRYSDANPEQVATADSPAYVLYTSGSTGKPKGVVVPHRGVVRLVKGTNYMEFTPDDVFLQLAPISFDASTLEIWGSLLNGARLIVMAPGLPALSDIGWALRHWGVTTLWLTAGLFHLMVEEQLDALRGLRYLLAGGDILSVQHVNKVLRELNNCCLINGYGPTENTTFTTCHALKAGEQVSGSVPIGRPIANTQVFILDQYLQPVPVGVPGELYAAGDGLALGYWRRPDLTEERFVPNPFHQGGRLYRTGDLVRYRPDLTIEFLGRLDQQVKLRGFRIELGEIQSALSGYPGLRDTVVTVDQDSPGAKRLVAYFIADEGVVPEPGDLRRFLQERLPDYMVPAAFISLNAFPLTPNGKIDYRGLPKPHQPENPKRTASSATNLERGIARVWCEVLRVDQVGLDDNFFELGGTSLLLLQLQSRLREIVGDLSIIDLFKYPTVSLLAQNVTDRTRVHAEATMRTLDRVAKRKGAAMRQGQKRMEVHHD